MNDDGRRPLFLMMNGAMSTVNIPAEGDSWTHHRLFPHCRGESVITRAPCLAVCLPCGVWSRVLVPGDAVP